MNRAFDAKFCIFLEKSNSRTGRSTRNRQVERKQSRYECSIIVFTGLSCSVIAVEKVFNIPVKADLRRENYELRVSAEEAICA